MKNRFPDAKKVYVPTKSWAIKESCVLRSPEGMDARRGIVYETVLGESWVHPFLPQHSLVSWSSGVVSRLVAVLLSRVSFLSTVAGYMVPAVIFHTFSVIHGNG